MYLSSPYAMQPSRSSPSRTAFNDVSETSADDFRFLECADCFTAVVEGARVSNHRMPDKVCRRLRVILQEG